MKRIICITGILLAISLTGCTSLPSVENPSSGAEQPTEASGTPDYLAKVDANGLINGRSYAAVVGEATFKCLSEKGWADVELSDTGSIILRDASKSDSFDKDMQLCSETVNSQYPLPPVTDRALEERYALELTTKDCLNQLGYSITDAPSKKTWVEQMRSGSADIWLPYAELFTNNRISPADEKKIKQTCADPAERVYVG
ncbi:hypothetical protein [Arthrobacter sp. GMC3]|uniref:hypothetical protein n=1 Tax=Arthrobacter sp. GMC3 TaxID=2058894 RepID=UPI0015E3BABA|nr:hypothetical protein [Arthrobacter sp. GMC3]